MIWSYFLNLSRDVAMTTNFCWLNPHLFLRHAIPETAWDRHTQTTKRATPVAVCRIHAMYAIHTWMTLLWKWHLVSVVLGSVYCFSIYEAGEPVCFCHNDTVIVPMNGTHCVGRLSYFFYVLLMFFYLLSVISVKPIISTSTRPIFTELATLAVDERSEVIFFDPSSDVAMR